jgi:hypothetical protein
MSIRQRDCLMMEYSESFPLSRIGGADSASRRERATSVAGACDLAR